MFLLFKLNNIQNSFIKQFSQAKKSFSLNGDDDDS